MVAVKYHSALHGIRQHFQALIRLQQLSVQPFQCGCVHKYAVIHLLLCREGSAGAVNV